MQDQTAIKHRKTRDGHQACAASEIEASLIRVYKVGNEVFQAGSQMSHRTYTTARDEEPGAWSEKQRQSQKGSHKIV